MQAMTTHAATFATSGEILISEPEDSPAAEFGKCKMCNCPRYTTSSNDWQFCDCGHSRSQHQH
jgi:hypothetical protein